MTTPTNASTSERTNSLAQQPVKPRSSDADVVVLGGGSAGLGAARAARRRGASVVLIEQASIGGDCTFTGCIPSKAVLEAAGRGQSFDQAMAEAERAIATVAATENASVLRRDGIEVIEGSARLADRTSVIIDGHSLRATKAIIIATGASPAVPPIPGIETVRYLTNETLFQLEKLPSSLAVLGGGPIGVEMADAFARLGSNVTIVEATDRLLPREEAVASEVLASVFSNLGITTCVGSAVARVESIDGAPGVSLHLGSGRTIDAEALLVAVGRTPDTKGLDLDRAGVEVDHRGFIRVDARLRTTARHVFAAGDVAEPLQFTHVAYRTGYLAATNALSPIPLLRFRPESVPWVTFTSPEVARVGLTEVEAVRRGGRVAFLPMAEVDRAVAANRTQGFIKLIAGPRFGLRNLGGGRLLGATIVAERAGEMLHEIVLALRAGMFPARLALTTHAYPTWSMAVQQAAAQFFGEYGGRQAQPASPGADTGVMS